MGVEGIARDITERKRAAAALRESEERFRMFSEASSEGIVIHDQAEIMEANNTAALMCGYDPSEVSGMPLLAFAAPNARETFGNILAGHEKRLYAIASDDGSTFPGRSWQDLDYEAGRRVTLFVITERTQAERALRKANHAQYDYERLLVNLPHCAACARGDITTIFTPTRIRVNPPMLRLSLALYEERQMLHASMPDEARKRLRNFPRCHDGTRKPAVATGQIIIE